jgi:hypothetical protein
LTVKPLFFFPADLPNTIQKNIGKNKYTLDNIWKKMNKVFCLYFTVVVGGKKYIESDIKHHNHNPGKK